MRCRTKLAVIFPLCVIFSCCTQAYAEKSAASATKASTASAVATTDKINIDAMRDFLQIDSGLRNKDFGIMYAQNKYIAQDIDKGDINKEYDFIVAPLTYSDVKAAFIDLDKMKIKDEGELGVAAKDLRAKLDVLHQEEKQLKIYYETAEYKTDNFEKGKSADARIKDELKQAVQSYSVFHEKFTPMFRSVLESQLADLEKAGQKQTAFYHRIKTLLLSQKLVSLLASDKEFKNADTVAAMDTTEKELQASLLELQTATADCENGGGDSCTSVDDFSSVLRAYRFYKTSKSQSDFNAVVNSFVGVAEIPDPADEAAQDDDASQSDDDAQ
jgi:hypothetical protein